MIDNVVMEKLENIKNCLARIEQKIPFSVERLTSDLDLQDIITVNIQRSIQSSVDLGNHLCVLHGTRTPKDMADTFVVLNEIGCLSTALSTDLKKSVGLRNVLVHDYSGVDWNIVHRVAHQNMGIFKEFIRAVLNKTSG